MDISLSPAQLAASSFAADASTNKLRRPIGGLLIKPDRVIATDSYRLIEVQKPKAVHPEINVDVRGLIVARKATKKQTTLITLHYADENAKEGKATILNEDGTTVTAPTGETLPEKYPTYEAILPTGKPRAFTKLNATYLKEMADFAAKHCGDRIIVEIYDHLSPAVFRMEADAYVHPKGQHPDKATGLIMPLRMSREEIDARELQKEVKPVQVHALALKAEDLPF